MCLSSQTLLFPVLIAIGTTAAADPAIKESEANGVTIPYAEEGMGETIVFLHGAMGDFRVWEGVRPDIAGDHHFIAPTMRYHGTGEWPDKGENYSILGHADDMAAFIDGLGAGPVHLVGWSMGGDVATALALKYPDLLQSLILYEGSPWTMIDAEENAAAFETMGSNMAAVSPAVEEGNDEKATRLLIEGVFQMDAGGFDSLPPDFQQVLLDNARTMPIFWAKPAFDPTCEMLKQFDKPVLLAHGEDSIDIWRLADETSAPCLPQAEIAALPGVNHDGPMRDPAAFAAMVKQFVNSH